MLLSQKPIDLTEYAKTIHKTEVHIPNKPLFHLNTNIPLTIKQVEGMYPQNVKELTKLLWTQLK